MKVYTFVDSRKIDRYEEFQLYEKREDAQTMKYSFGLDAKFFDIHEVEVIK